MGTNGRPTKHAWAPSRRPIDASRCLESVHPRTAPSKLFLTPFSLRPCCVHSIFASYFFSKLKRPLAASEHLVRLSSVADTALCGRFSRSWRQERTCFRHSPSGLAPLHRLHFLHRGRRGSQWQRYVPPLPCNSGTGGVHSYVSQINCYNYSTSRIH